MTPPSQKSHQGDKIASFFRTKIQHRVDSLELGLLG